MNRIALALSFIVILLLQGASAGHAVGGNSAAGLAGISALYSISRVCAIDAHIAAFARAIVILQADDGGDSGSDDDGNGSDDDIWSDFDNTQTSGDKEEDEKPLEPPTPEEIVERPPLVIDLPGKIQLTITQIITDEEHFPTVQAYVSVLDENGNPVKTLKPEHFEMSEEGISAGQPIFADPMSRAPLAVVFVVDTSVSMKLALGLEKHALKTFIDRLGDDDVAALISFSDVPVIEYYFTPDKEKLKTAVDDLRIIGRTAMYDAVIDALEIALEKDGYRRAVVVLTDGMDNQSTNDINSAIQYYEENAEAENKGVTIYTLGLGEQIDPQSLSRLAERTGGRFLESPTPGDLDRVYREIITQIENEYVLEYSSPHTHNLGQMVTTRVDADYYGIAASAETIYRIPGLGKALARLAWPGIVLTVIMTIVLIIVTYLKITRAVWVTVMITPLEGKDYTVSGGYAAIGSAEDNDIMLRNDPNIEPHHAILKETNDGYVAEALTRDHPIGIRSEWVRKVLLRDRDALWLGNTMILFRERALRTGERHPAEYPDDELPPLDGLADRFDAAALPTRLAVTSGPHAGQSFSLAVGKATYIGRTKQESSPDGLPVTVDIVLENDMRISRIHAAIRRDEMGCWISDIGSTNGTFVDGVRITVETPLTAGSTIQVGDSVIKAE